MKKTIASVLISLSLVVAIFLLSKDKSNISGIDQNNVSVVDGKQIVDITAKGGYTPIKSSAKAGVPTILRLNTSGTFDCSSFVRVPSLGIAQALPQSSTTEIDLGVQPIGVLHGTCGMGMYPFEIDFQN